MPNPWHRTNKLVDLGSYFKNAWISNQEQFSSNTKLFLLADSSYGYVFLLPLRFGLGDGAEQADIFMLSFELGDI
jgi:hypothetical protein